MNALTRIHVAAAAILSTVVFAGCQTSPTAQARAGQVVVEFADLEKFTDFGDGPWGPSAALEDHAAAFRDALTDEARRHLREGQTLSVTFRDVDLAGDHLPSMRAGVNSFRVVKDIYPPRIKLTFTLSDASGAVLKQGERTLQDHAFMMRVDISMDRALRYDLRLLRDWVRDELRDAAVARA